MSDISLPPEAPKTDAPNPAAKKTSSGTRSLLTFLALIAPLPLLISAADLWLTYTPEGQALKETPFGLIRQITNGIGDPPLWLLAVCLLPSAILLAVLARGAIARIAALALLLLFATGEILFLAQLGEGFIR